MTEKIFILSCIVYAIYYSMLEGEVFSFIRRRWDKVEEDLFLCKGRKLSHKFMYTIRNPLFDCPVCMAPWWGTNLYWLIWHNNTTEWLICIFAAMGLNFIIAKISRE